MSVASPRFMVGRMVWMSALRPEGPLEFDAQVLAAQQHGGVEAAVEGARWRSGATQERVGQTSSMSGTVTVVRAGSACPRARPVKTSTFTIAKSSQYCFTRVR